MKLKEVKNIIELANELGIDKTELFDNIQEGNENFEVENYRFITDGEGLKETVNKFEYDPYILGCFNTGFLSDFIQLDYDDIETLRETDKGIEIVGKLVLNSGNLEEMMEEYIRLDGIGHALNSYDDDYHEITLNDIDYNYFRF